ncbi:MAG: hypothetical protein ACREJ3_08185 [Polyangiaceae bacterium]
MAGHQVCVNCQKNAPETDTNYTLISAQFGWRLTRSIDPDGTIVLEWRCPTCWQDYKRKRTVQSVPPPPMTGTAHRRDPSSADTNTRAAHPGPSSDPPSSSPPTARRGPR